MSERGIAVVAGSTGYLGRHVVRALAEEGWRVRALVRDPARLGEAREACAEVFEGHATRPETLEGLFDGAEVAFSSIGTRGFSRKPSFWEVDFQANLNLVEAAERAGVRRFAFVSVLHGGEMRASVPVAEARERVVDRLLASKMEAVVLRPTGFFNDMGDFFEMARRGRAWVIGSGESRLNPIHGADLAAVVAEALSAPSPEQEIEAGGPDVFTQRAIAELAFRVLGREPRISRVPVGLLRAGAALLAPWNPNASSFLKMFSMLGERDAVAPRHGTHHLEEHFRELARAAGS